MLIEESHRPCALDIAGIIHEVRHLEDLEVFGFAFLDFSNLHCLIVFVHDLIGGLKGISFPMAYIFHPIQVDILHIHIVLAVDHWLWLLLDFLFHIIPYDFRRFSFGPLDILNHSKATSTLIGSRIN